MSFHEKSAWICLLGIMVVYVPYFWLVFAVPHVAVSLVAFIGAALVLVVLMSVFHIVISLFTRNVLRTGDVPPLDEREQMIELRAVRVSAIVRAVVVLVWCGLAMIGVAGHAESGAVPHARAVQACQALFAGFVLANVVYYVVVVAGYRRSV